MDEKETLDQEGQLEDLRIPPCRPESEAAFRKRKDVKARYQLKGGEGIPSMARTSGRGSTKNLVRPRSSLNKTDF